MANFNFSSLNKERMFDFDTSKITGEYTNLESLYQRDGEDTQYQVKAVYVSTKSEYNDESPILALADTYVNLPQHQLPDIKAMINTPSAVAAINNGFCGFKIRKYEKQLKNKKGKLQPKTCYSAEWINVDPDDFADSESEYVE